MLKSITAVFVTVIFLVCLVPAAFAEDNGRIIFSDSFESYAENETSPSGIKISTGLDSRVIAEDGSKVFFSRALGEDVNFGFSADQSDAAETVVSAKMKITGVKTSGKLFNLVFSGTKVNFINMDEDGVLKLYDNTIIGGMPASYTTITVHAKWKKKVFSVYIDKKCVANNWAMPSAAATKSPTAVEFSVDYSEKGETDVYVDWLRMYEGNNMPWDMSFPAEKRNSNVLDFSPTEDFNPNSVNIIRDFSYDGSGVGLMFGNITSEINNYTLDDGRKVMRWYSPEDRNITNGFADISLPELASKTKYVFDLKFKVNKLTGGSRVCLFDTKDTEGLWTVRGFEFGSGGRLTADFGGGGADIPFDEWVRLSFVYNMKLGKIDIYVNGEYVSENTTTAGAVPVYWRFDLISPAGSEMDVYFDWFRIYGGNTLLDDSYFTADSGVGIQSDDAVKSAVTVMDSAEKVNEAIFGKTVFLTANNSMYLNGQKEILPDAQRLINIDGRLMIPLSTFARIAGDTPSSGADGSFSLGGKTANLSAVTENGITYIPLRAAAEQLMGKKVSYDIRGMVIIADTEVDVRENPEMYIDRRKAFYSYDVIYRYLLFDNPTGEEIIEDLEKNYPEKAHPRIYWTNDDIKYVLNKIDTDPRWKEEVDKTINYADNILYIDMSSEFAAQGSSKQSAASRFQTYITALSTAHLLTGDKKYAEKGIEIMRGMASWSDSGYKSANLTIGHWSQGMGIGFDSFYNYMASTPEGRKDIKYFAQRIKEIQYDDHIAAYSKGITSGPSWITYQDNFVGCIGGGMMCALLAVCDEDGMREESAYLLENVLRSLYIAAETFYPDGGYYEGLTYGDMMLENFTNALDAMFNCCGTDYGIGRVPGFSKAGEYFVYMNGPAGRFNFHDDDNYYYNRFVPEYMAFRYGETLTGQMGHDSKRLADLKFIINYGLKGLYYYDKAITDTGVIPDVSAAPLDKYFGNIGTGTFRNSHADEKFTFVGYHGGYSNIPHDMLDLGEFIYIADGVKWAVDLGKDSYSLPNYFQVSGYNIYRKRPEGENCIVLNPEKDPSYYGQTVGAASKLTLLDENKPFGAMAALDLTEAYSRDADKYIRGYYFGDNRHTLTIRDEITLKGDTEIYWFMHTSADIRITGDNSAVLTKDGKTLTVDVITNCAGAELTQMAASPLPKSPQVAGQAQNDGYRKLAIHVPSASGDVSITVKLSPSGDYENTPISDTKISDWVIPDSGAKEQPRFTGIYADGRLLADFAPGRSSYTVSVPCGTQNVPEITAQCDKGSVYIAAAKSLSESTVLSVKCDGYDDTVCTIKFAETNNRPINVTKLHPGIYPKQGIPTETIPPTAVSAVNTPADSTALKNLTDGDSSTVFTLSSANSWIEYDLGEIKDINGVSMVFQNGETSILAYKIMYSENGYDFYECYDGLSTGTSREVLDMPARARYVRLVGMGTRRASGTTGVAEFAVY